MSLQHDLLTGPIERLLVAGGDTRLELDPNTGLNKYGVGPAPRQALPFGSCTASSPSARAVQAAREVQAMLLQAHQRGGLERFAHQTLQRLRIELASLLGIDQIPEARLVLTPSGTDAEILASVLALGDGQRLCNIVVGPGEVGSGTTLAASGRHFSALTPRGGATDSGSPLAGGLDGLIELETIELRCDDGKMRSTKDLDAEARRKVERAAAAGHKVLLHVVAHSKTGAHAPSLATVAKLCDEHPEALSVMIDAAQGRFSRRGLLEVLDRGYMVLITGSKFYGGPPFSGALVVPPQMAPQMVGGEDLPQGADDYFSAAELPTEWTRWRACLSDAPNLGLLLRWAAAMAEIRAYYQSDPEGRYAALRAFERLVPQILGDSDCVEVLPVAPPRLADGHMRLLESKTTVYPFRLHPPGQPQHAFDKPRLLEAFKALNQDIAHLAPEADEATRAALSRSFHLGQPVVLSAKKGRSALRVAIGGVLLIALAQDARLGQTMDDRVAWLEQALGDLRLKLEWLASHLAD